MLKVVLKVMCLSIFLRATLTYATNLNQNSSLMQSQEPVHFDMVGSESSSLLIRQLLLTFEQHHSKFSVAFQSQGSEEVPVALLQGTAIAGSMSRAMNSAEKVAFLNRYGYPITELIVAYDALVIITSPDIQLKSITLAQLDAIFSITRRCGYPEPINDWRQLAIETKVSTNYEVSNHEIKSEGGLIEKNGQKHPIKKVSRKSGSGSYQQFRQLVLCDGDLAQNVSLSINNQQLSQDIAYSTEMIGYTSLAYVRNDINIVAINDNQGNAVLPTMAAIQQGRYPLIKNIYLYLNLKPQLQRVAHLTQNENLKSQLTNNETSEPLLREFARYLYSKAGIDILIAQGYIPLNFIKRQQQLEKIPFYGYVKGH